jgi:hypothetical protein
MEFIRDGKTTSFEAEMATKRSAFHVGVVEGSGAKNAKGFQVPYKGAQLEGAPLKAQIDAWVDYGTIEACNSHLTPHTTHQTPHTTHHLATAQCDQVLVHMHVLV